MSDGPRRGLMKRKGGSGDGKFQHSRKGPKGKKAKRVFSGKDDIRVKKMDWKTKKFFQRKARDYDSDGDDDDDDDDKKDEEEKEEDEDEVKVEKERFIEMEDEPIGKSRKNGSDDDVDGEEEDGSELEEGSEDENGKPGILRFSAGSKSFRLAFQKIMLKNNPPEDDILGPILSANKNLIAEKLAEEDEERKVKTEAKKEKHLVGEKGHVKPANYLDSHEKSLIGTATRGVVKLFNAVNKAQHAQKGLNPTRSKDEKVIKKRRKEAFFSVLGQAPSNQTGTLSKGESSSGTGSGDAPSWAPLRDNYMLTNSKLKDWDKMKDTTTSADDFELPPGAVSSSDDE